MKRRKTYRGICRHVVYAGLMKKRVMMIVEKEVCAAFLVEMMSKYGCGVE